MTKRCSSCKQSKPLDEFNKNRNRRDGLQTWCRECSKRRGHEYWQTPKGRATRSQGQKRYEKTGKGKATQRRYQAKRFTQGPGLDRWVEKIAREVEE